MSSRGCEALIDGETIVLLPERALWWPARRTLVVADTHFGKSAVFARQGISVPDGVDHLDRSRLSALVTQYAALRLVILGDFLHSALAAESATAKALHEWLVELRPVVVQVIAGNHDRHVLRRWQPPVAWEPQEWLEPPFRFVHDADREALASSLFTFSGHVHPVTRFRGLRKLSRALPVFWQRGRNMVLPSFGLFTGGYRVQAAPGDTLYAVGPERVLRLPNV